MDVAEFRKLINEIVGQARKLKDNYTSEKNACVNYCAIFSHTLEEYNELVAVANKLGRVIEDTPTGPLFLVEPLETVAGQLKLVKVRKPDEARKERGDADFTVSDYSSFKETYLSKPGFKLITRPKFEMIELAAKDFNVLTYFSNPPLDKQFGV